MKAELAMLTESDGFVGIFNGGQCPKHRVVFNVSRLRHSFASSESDLSLNRFVVITLPN